MILDTMQNARSYYAAHRMFEKAFEFLGRKDLAQLPAGRVEIAGDALFAIVAQKEGAGKAAKLESHRKYLDIQVPIRGLDLVGWSPLAACTENAEPFDAAKDIGFFSGRPEIWLPTPPGTFLILYPQDVHAPFGGEGMLHKVVVKVAV